MKRRAFVLGLGTALATWQLPARAEAEARTIGLWWSAQQLNGELSRYKRRLADLSWSENGKVRFQALAWGGDTTIMGKQAGELLAMHPDVIGARHLEAAQRPSSYRICFRSGPGWQRLR
jgi:hypothetical protein